MSYFAWTVTFFVTFVVSFFAFTRLDTLKRKRKGDPVARRRLTIAARVVFGFAIACLVALLYCMARGVGQDNNTYARQCHDRGGVVTHDGCFKPGSEIHIP